MNYNNNLQAASGLIGAEMEQSEINYAANQVDSSLGVLSSLLDSLITQIEPVLKMQPPQNPSGILASGRTVTSAFANGLINQRNKIDELSDRVRNALDRLAL